jgi:hypothetical protein
METAGYLTGPGGCQVPISPPLSKGGLLVVDEPEARSLLPLNRPP